MFHDKIWLYYYEYNYIITCLKIELHYKQNRKIFG